LSRKCELLFGAVRNGQAVRNYISLSDSRQRKRRRRLINTWGRNDMGAMMPGNDISMLQVLIPERCEKCHARFFVYMPNLRHPRIDEKWCDSCNDDPTTDISEDEYWAVTHTQPYIFAGWKFRVYESPTDPDGVTLRLFKKLPYPESPSKFMSASWGLRSDMPRLAAWLIGHWYEHLLQVCPCLHGERDQAVDEGDGSPFRKAIIQSLLWYHKQGLI
jgi:hypothetical protein